MTAPLGKQLVLVPLNLSVSLDQSFGHIYLFFFLINLDKTRVVESVLTSHCMKSLLQFLFFDISFAPLQFMLIKHRVLNISAYITSIAPEKVD